MKFVRWARNVVILSVALLVVAVGAGFVYEVVSERVDLKNYPAPGKYSMLMAMICIFTARTKDLKQ